MNIMEVIKGWFVSFELSKWVVAYLILLVPIVVSWSYALGLHKELFSTSLRATFQLILIGLILVPIFNSGLFVQIGLLIVMIVLGSYIARERGKTIKGAYGIALISILVSFLFTITVFILTGSLEVLPNIIIPISGMMIGNAVRSVSLNFHKAEKDFELNQSVVEAMLIEGVAVREALKIPARDTLKNAMVPRIDSLKTLGIVHIPGAMAGMMVAGADPLLAAGYQILIFFGIVSISALATIIANALTYRALFIRAYPHLK